MYLNGINITGILSCFTKNPAKSIIGKINTGDRTAACSILLVNVAVINPKLSQANPFKIVIQTKILKRIYNKKLKL